MSIDLSAYKVDADSSDKVTVLQHNLLLQAVQNALNNIQNDQIEDDTIALNKVEGGAVPESDVTMAGSSCKILMTTSSAAIVIKDGGSIRVTLA